MHAAMSAHMPSVLASRRKKTALHEGVSVTVVGAFTGRTVAARRAGGTKKICLFRDRACFVGRLSAWEVM